MRKINDKDRERIFVTAASEEKSLRHKGQADHHRIDFIHIASKITDTKTHLGKRRTNGANKDSEARVGSSKHPNENSKSKNMGGLSSSNQTRAMPNQMIQNQSASQSKIAKIDMSMDASMNNSNVRKSTRIKQKNNANGGNQQSSIVNSPKGSPMKLVQSGSKQKEKSAHPEMIAINMAGSDVDQSMQQGNGQAAESSFRDQTELTNQDGDSSPDQMDYSENKHISSGNKIEIQLGSQPYDE